MQRVVRGALAAACLLGAGTGIAAFSTPVLAAATADAATASDSGWQQDGSHDGSSSDPTFDDQLSLAWTKQGFPSDVWQSLIVGSEVFVDAAVNADRTGTEVEALSLATGDTIWGPVSVGEGFGGSLAFDDNTLFAVNTDGTITALDPLTGRAEWTRHETGPLYSPPVTEDGTIYLSGPAGVESIAESTGGVNWTLPVGNDGLSGVAVDSTGLYVADGCTGLFAVDVSIATVRWSRPDTSYCNGAPPPPVLHGGVVSYNQGDDIDGYAESDGSAITPPYPSEGLLAADADAAVTQWGQELTLFDANTGAELWDSDESSGPGAAPLLVNGYLVAATNLSTVALVDERTGSEVWSEQQAAPMTGVWNSGLYSDFSEAEGSLAVPGLQALTMYRSSDAPVVAITSGPSDGSYVGADATFTWRAGDSKATFTCTVDDVSQPCRSPYTVEDLSNGEHTFSVNETGLTSAFDSRTFFADRVAPDPKEGSLPAFITARHATLAVSASDAGSGTASISLRERFLPANGKPSSWQPLPGQSGSGPHDVSITMPQATEVCVEARARDAVGNISPWSRMSCTTRLMDDRGLTASSGWYRGVQTGDFDHTFTATRRHGASLSVRPVSARTIDLAVLRCPRCGSVVVTAGHHRHWFSLRAGRLRVSALRFAGADVGNGPVVIRVASRHRPVEIDGIGFERE